MNVPVPLRYAAAAVLGVAAGAAVWLRVSEIRPYLEIQTRRTIRTENYDVWDVSVTARGGETIPAVRVEPQSPRLHLMGPGTYEGLPSGWTKVFRVQLDDPGNPERCGVRVSQEGPDSSTQDLWVGGGS